MNSGLSRTLATAAFLLLGALVSDTIWAQTPVYLTQWGSHGSGNGQFAGRLGIATDASGNVYIVDWGNDRVEKFGSAATVTKNFTRGGIKRLYR